MPLNERWLKLAYWNAGENWMMWAEDFEFIYNTARLNPAHLNPAHLPVLANHDRYHAFIKTYNLLRYNTTVQRNAIREYLHNGDDFSEAVNDPTGEHIDNLADALQEQFPYLNLERSLLSKLAMLAMPHSFLPWDRFARKGLAILAHGRAGGNFNTYADYLQNANNFLNDVHHEIEKFLICRPIPTDNDNRQAFIRRIFDGYLMIQGGRWQNIIAGH